jgi:cytosine/adenosine deaminase-related metal-dependent hydrolase
VVAAHGRCGAALGLAGVVGNLQPGCEADFVVLNPEATPLLARKHAQARAWTSCCSR